MAGELGIGIATLYRTIKELQQGYPACALREEGSDSALRDREPTAGEKYHFAIHKMIAGSFFWIIYGAGH